MAPSSICFPLEEQADLDGSEVTWLCDGDENSLSPIMHQASPTYGRGDEDAEQRQSESVELQLARQRREFVELKLQLAKQQEELDVLKEMCGRYHVENEALRTETQVLTDELALLRKDKEDKHHPIARRSSWFCRHERQEASGGSMQMLVDTNSRLMTDNARLQVSVDGLKKSLQSYIKKSSLVDKETIEALKMDNQSLRQQILSESPVPEKISLGEDTAKTSMESDDFSDGIESPVVLFNTNQVETERDLAGSLFQEASRNSNNRTTEKGEATAAADGEDIEENSPKKPRCDRSDSEELLVDFGDRRRYRGAARRWHSIVY